MKRNFRTFQEKTLEDLQDKDFAIAYLNAALLDEDPRIFLLALKNIYEARGETMVDLAEKTALSRENIYRILSKKGNPTIRTIAKIVHQSVA